MKAPLPDSTHATDEVVARIDPLWRSWESARGGHAAFVDSGMAATVDGPQTIPADVVGQVEAALSGGVPDGV